MIYKDYSISIFPQYPKNSEKNVFVEEKYLFRDWSEVKNYLFEQHKINIKKKTENLHVVSGLTLDGKRTLESFNQTSCVYFQDIDDTRGLSVREFVKKFNSLNHNYILYYSASYTKERPRFRMAFNLTRPILKKEFLHFWTNFYKLYDNYFDKQSNYLSKPNGLPRTFEGVSNFIGEMEGNPVCVESVKESFIYIPPEEKIILPNDYYLYKIRKQSLNGKIVSWSNIYDCPFTNTKNVLNRINYYKSIMNTDGMGRFNEFKGLIGSIIGTAHAMGYNVTVGEIIRLLMDIDSVQVRKKQKSHEDSIKKLLRR